MKRQPNIAIGALVGVLAGGNLAGAQDDVLIYGIVRDFRMDHPDFAVSGTPAHVAGNVETALPSTGAPEFRGGGFRVAAQWTNSSSDPIAPHMYMVGAGPQVQVSSAPTIDNQSYADTYEPPYVASNAGPAPRFVINPTMPAITEPTGLPSIGEWKRDQNGGLTVLSSGFNCEKFLVGTHHTVQISGDVTVIVREEFKLQNHAKLHLMPGATFTVYARKVFTIQDQCEMGDPADPSRVKIYKSGTEDLILQNQVELHATVVSPNARILVQDGSDFYGNYTGKGVFLKNQAGFHITGTMPSTCGFVVADAPGLPGASNAGYITSAGSFGQWFSEAPGHNAAIAHPITLAQTGGGFREFRSSAFYPVDHELYGNQGQAHNNNFTFSLRKQFTFRECTNQVIELQGSDDIWVFVNDKMVIDLGGIGANQTQAAELDRLDIGDGEEATLTIFYAHRSGGTPSLAIRTNLEIIPEHAEIAGFPGWD